MENKEQICMLIMHATRKRAWWVLFQTSCLSVQAKWRLTAL